ncbi:glycosyl hydrolase [Paenibacillus sp. GCM10027626]|uniref:glycosyl hydrolase n=1 Tax=Paenibacillus sp. GCM10027626 TaxID=3273411 RepID=UPI003643FDDD
MVASTAEFSNIKTKFTSPEPPRSLYPLFWLHGDERETEAVLRQEIAAMDEGGCGGFVIESRPHKDYLGEGWWRDVAICLDEAEKRRMKVWIFDEEFFPSGIAGGKVLQDHPKYRMKALVREQFSWEQVTSFPLAEGNLQAWDEVLSLSVHAASEVAGQYRLFDNCDELLAWSRQPKTEASACSWQINVIGLKPTWSGREIDKMVDYIDPEVADRFIKLTYEATKERFGHLFGTVIQGFFGDETSFENFGSYDYLFGPETPSLPWTRQLFTAFRAQKGYSLREKLNLLWDDAPLADPELARETMKVRFDYMDVMTALFSEHFFGRIQRWCHENRVQFIGHIVEDNHAHMHHGYGVGHFFRATKHFDMGGYDFVLRQIDPGQKLQPYTEHYPQFATYRKPPYPDFFHFTLAKLAQSAAHLEVGSDLIMCENFGAYGWDLSMKEMKWLTDWQTIRGTNWYVPHAFSPIFPDPDCPPHFYAGGRNPLWPFFRPWADYANRSCFMLQDAQQIARIAVVYPAESHWSGDPTRLDEVCRSLMENQWDFNIVSCDLLTDSQLSTIAEGRLHIRDASFRTIILPGVRTLPLAVMERLAAFVQAGGQLIALDALPDRECRGAHEAVSKLAGELSNASTVTTVTLDQLSDAILTELRSISLEQPCTELRYAHYFKAGINVFFLHNESPTTAWSGTIRLHAAGIPELWNPMDGSVRQAAAYSCGSADTAIWLSLAPFAATFVVLAPDGTVEQLDHLEIDDAVLQQSGVQAARDASGTIQVWEPIDDAKKRMDEVWQAVTVSSTLDEIDLPQPAEIPAMQDWLTLPASAKFSGTVTYQCQLKQPAADGADGADGQQKYVLDCGEIGGVAEFEVNGVKLPPQFCPPYQLDLLPSMFNGQAGCTIRLAVTNTLGAYIENYCNPGKPAPAGLLGPVTLQAYRRLK